MRNSIVIPKFLPKETFSQLSIDEQITTITNLLKIAKFPPSCIERQLQDFNYYCQHMHVQYRLCWGHLFEFLFKKAVKDIHDKLKFPNGGSLFYIYPGKDSNEMENFDFGLLNYGIDVKGCQRFRKLDGHWICQTGLKRNKLKKLLTYFDKDGNNEYNKAILVCYDSDTLKAIIVDVEQALFELDNGDTSRVNWNPLKDSKLYDNAYEDGIVFNFDKWPSLDMFLMVVKKKINA